MLWKLVAFVINEVESQDEKKQQIRTELKISQKVDQMDNEEVIKIMKFWKPIKIKSC